MLVFRMKKMSFYILNNNLYKLNDKKYLTYLKTNILNQDWFKKACKEKKIRITYLSKKISTDTFKNVSTEYKRNSFYFYKLFLLKFSYDELENNNHLKLLNINIRNETVFKVITFLESFQKLFLKTNYYQNINRIDRKTFVSEYSKKFNSYLNIPILGKILNNIEYISKTYIYKLVYLMPKKTFLYSLFIKDIINSNLCSPKSDSNISEILFVKYNIKISRRVVCDIRNKYLIPKIQRRKIFNFYLYNEKLYDKKRILNKHNISILENNLEGIYELSSNKIKKYYHSKNNILYIGSSKSIKKRLSTYTSSTAHSKNIRSFMKKEKEIYFRIIKSKNYKELEMQFINAFIDINGELPKLNKQRVLNIK